jgi:hypothetical protein
MPWQPSFGPNEGCRSVTRVDELRSSASRNIRWALLGSRRDRVRWCRRPCHRGRCSPCHRGRRRRPSHGRRRRGGSDDRRCSRRRRRHPRRWRCGVRRWRHGVRRWRRCVRRRCCGMRRRQCSALLSDLRLCRGRRRGRRRRSRPLTQSRRRGRDRSDRRPWRGRLLFRPVFDIGRSRRRCRRRQSCVWVGGRVRVRSCVQIRGRPASRSSGRYRRRTFGPWNGQRVGPRRSLRQSLWCRLGRSWGRSLG